MDSASAPSPLPSSPIAGDTPKTGSLIPSNDIIMRFLSSKAGPCSAKGLLVGALFIGDNVIPLQAVPVRGQADDLSLLLDTKNTTSISVVIDGAPCAVDSGTYYDSYHSTKVILLDGSNNEQEYITLVSNEDDESSTLSRRGFKGSNTAGVALLAGTLIASTAVIRKASHMSVIPHGMRNALGLADDRSSPQMDPIVLKVTQKELEEIARKLIKKGDDDSSSKREEDESTLLVKRSLFPVSKQEVSTFEPFKDMDLLLPSSIIKDSPQPVFPSARQYHGQGRNRLSEMVLGSLAVAGMVTCSAAATVDTQMPFGFEQVVPPSTTVLAQPVVEPTVSSQAWQSSPLHLVWSTDEVTSNGNTPILFVPVEAFKRPGSRRGVRTVRRTYVQEVSDSTDDFDVTQWPALKQEVAMDKRAATDATPAKGIKKGTVAKAAALTGIIGFVTRSWLHPPVEQVMEKRSDGELFSIQDDEMIKRAPGTMPMGKGLAAIGAAGIAGWMVQVNGHEAPEKVQAPPPGVTMIQQRAAPSAGMYAEEEGSLVRRCHGDDCYKQKVIVSESKNGEQIKVYTGSGREIIYDKHRGKYHEPTKEEIQRGYDSIHHNIHQSLRHRMAKILHLDYDDRDRMQSNSASSKMRAPGMVKWQVFFVTLLSFALFASSTSASAASDQGHRLVKRSPLPTLTQYAAPPPVAMTGAGLAGASSNGLIHGVQGLYHKEQPQNIAPLTKAELEAFGMNKETGKSYGELANEPSSSKLKKEKGQSRKLLKMSSKEAEKYLGAGNLHNLMGVGPQKSLEFFEGPPGAAPAPAPGKSSGGSRKVLQIPSKKERHMRLGPDFSHFDNGIGPQIYEPSSAPIDDFLPPLESTHAPPPTKHSRLPGGGIGPETGINPDQVTPSASPPAKHGGRLPGGGVGPQTGIVFNEGSPNASPTHGKEVAQGPTTHGRTANTKETPSHHDAEFRRKSRMALGFGGAAVGTVALTGTALACKKYGKGCGTKEVQDDMVQLSEGGKVHPSDAHHHMEHTTQHSAKAGAHHKRDLSSVVFVQESAPASAFQMTCLGQDCNAEVKTSKQPLWEPQTEWPVTVLSTGRSSALPDSFNFFESDLKKRSPGFEIATTSHAPATSHLSFNTAHAPASAVQVREYANYATSHDIPKVTEEPKMSKPNGIPSFKAPVIEDFIKADRSRQGQSSRTRSRKIGPAPPEAEREKGMVSMSSSPQENYKIKPNSHYRNQRFLGQQAEMTLDASQSLHSRLRQSHAPEPSVSIQNKGEDPLALAVGYTATAAYGAAGVCLVGAACYSIGKSALKNYREGQEHHREILREDGIELSTRMSARHQGTPLPTERDLSSLNIAGGHSLFKDVDTLHSRTNRLVKRNAIALLEDDGEMQKRHLPSAMMNAPVSTTSFNGIGSAASSVIASSQVHIPQYDNFATSADIPKVKEAPQYPPIKGEMLEFHKKVSPESYVVSNRRLLRGGGKSRVKSSPKSKSKPKEEEKKPPTPPIAACYGCYGSGSDEQEQKPRPPKGPGPWRGKRAFDLRKGSGGQKTVKVFSYFGALGAVGTCITIACVKRKAIKDKINDKAGEWKEMVAAVPGQIKGYLSSLANKMTTGRSRLSYSSAGYAAESEQSSQSSSSSSRPDHPSSAQLPRNDRWEPPYKPYRHSHHAMEIGMAKRDFEEDVYRKNCMANGRCSLFDGEMESSLRKRTVSLATTTNAPVLTSSLNGLGSAGLSSHGSSLVHIPEYSNFATDADIPRVDKEPKLPEIKGGALEFHKKANPDLYGNRRTLRYYGSSVDSYHNDLDEPGPWHGKNAIDFTKGNKWQKTIKSTAWITAIAGTWFGGKAVIRNAGAIGGSIKNKIVALPSQTVQAVKQLWEAGHARAGQAMQAAKNGLGKTSLLINSAWNKAENKASTATVKVKQSVSSHPYQEVSKARLPQDKDAHASEQSHHPSSLQLPPTHPREPIHKSINHPHAHHVMEMGKRGFKEENNHDGYLASTLFDEDESMTGLEVPHTLEHTSRSALSVVSSHSATALTFLPVLSFGFALTVGSIWLTLTMAKQSQVGQQPLLDFKGQDISIALHRPALLLLPLASTLATVSLGSIYALKPFTHSSSCSLVSYRDDLDDATDVAMNKRMSPRGKRVMQNAAILGISAGAAATGFIAIKALIGSPPPVEKRDNPYQERGLI